jgi:hypothetical protein
VELGEVAVEGFVAVHPDARGVEHAGEVGTVRRAQIVEQRAQGPSERGCVAFVVTATGGLARLREQPDADAQRWSSVMPCDAMFVRAVGIASRRAGSIGSPVTSSTP